MRLKIMQEAVDQAVNDARGHQEEFPGQLVHGDWDSEAWQATCIEYRLDDDERDAAWPDYQDLLHSTVRAMVGGETLYRFENGQLFKYSEASGAYIFCLSSPYAETMTQAIRMYEGVL